jgi:hypothetical protein
LESEKYFIITNKVEQLKKKNLSPENKKVQWVKKESY